MDQDSRPTLLTLALSRRAMLKWLLALPAPLFIAACTGQAPASLTQAATATSVPPTQAPPTQAPPTQAPPTQPLPTRPLSTQAPPTAVPPTQPLPTATLQAALAPTPECGDDDDDVTLAQTEGPYFKRSSPERTSLLESGVVGTKLVVTGHVLGTNCQPVAHALLDFWQADDKGQYDNAGFRLRGHQFTDASGRYTLETIVPGLYPGRTRHIHVKVQAPNKPVLTTQLYFPGEPANQRDGIYDKALEMQMQTAANGKTGTFNFVLKV